ncbi:MAG: S-methyl-5-thioribose-1-phosphate isomerase [Saprospiraceae bacterium]|nr:MAG: S-methyl-5-thioribose-1-phosphate isomerase [Saprospiraceae bacterium]
MKINGKPYRTIWLKPGDPATIQIIDQRHLPHELVIEDLTTLQDVASAIEEMHLRGAPLIGSAAAYGMYLAILRAPENTNWPDFFSTTSATLKATRPTAVNLAWAVIRVLETARIFDKKEEILAAALRTANALTEESVEHCRLIGQHGLELIRTLRPQKPKSQIPKPLNILTHCNAGWLACIDYGTATAPIYAAHNAGIPVHVWVDETRPRNQGARLTAYELGQHGVPHTVIADNTGGHLMQHGMVDMVITGSDRTTRTGDVANKIGTYLKALAARDNSVPFYVALPSSSIDWNIRDGVAEIPIEERDAQEVTHITGMDGGEWREVLLTPKDSPAANYAFDVTPARLVTGLITERGICAANEQALAALFPEKFKA